MVTCKDCIHEKVCFVADDTEYKSEKAIKLDCPSFKNKSDYTELKHGEWYLLDECCNEGVYCSVCHKKVFRTEYANQKVKSKYCPNCGVKMDGERE